MKFVIIGETDDRRAVLAYCVRCGVTEDDFPEIVLSPTGRAHHGLDGGQTACGHDATRRGWLWRI